MDVFVSNTRKLSPLGWFGWMLYQPYKWLICRAFLGFDDPFLWFGHDRTFAFLAFTVGESDLWHLSGRG